MCECVALFQFFIHSKVFFSIFLIQLKLKPEIWTKSCILMLDSKWHAHFTYDRSTDQLIWFLRLKSRGYVWFRTCIWGLGCLICMFDLISNSNGRAHCAYDCIANMPRWRKSEFKGSQIDSYEWALKESERMIDMIVKVWLVLWSNTYQFGDVGEIVRNMVTKSERTKIFAFFWLFYQHFIHSWTING